MDAAPPGGAPRANDEGDGAPGASRHLFSSSAAFEWALRALLGFIPLALLGALAHLDPALVFLLAAIAIVPLSALLGRATEEYAIHAGPGLGGLMNATFGNAVELIIALLAVSAGLPEVVKASLTGSILANLLLVLGMAMLAGGFRYKTQSLHRRGTMTSLSLMTLSVIALALPALFYWSSLAPGLFAVGTTPLAPAEVHSRLLALSLIVGAVMISIYLLGLVYSLVTHRHLFHEQVEEEAAEWSTRHALIVLAVATLGVAAMAELLVSSIGGLASVLPVSNPNLFVGVVVVAVIGNAAEHSTAVQVALKNKMDLAFQIAAGSSTQIALFVAPVLVFFSFAIGRPMELLFEVFELFSIAVAVAVAYAVSIDEETNWFEGALLVGVYIIICAVFYFHP